MLLQLGGRERVLNAPLPLPGVLVHVGHRRSRDRLARGDL